MCRNACSVYLYLLCLTLWCLFCGCWCEVWPVAVLKAAPCMWRVQHEGQRQAVKLETDTQMLQPVISPETAAAFQFFGGGIRHKTYRNFLHFQIAAIVMKPLYLNSWGQRLCSVQVWSFLPTIIPFVTSEKTLRFCQETKCGKGEQFETAPGVTSALSRWIMPHMSEAFCTAVAALDSRCTAHTGWCQMLSGSPVAPS